MRNGSKLAVLAALALVVAAGCSQNRGSVEDEGSSSAQGTGTETRTQQQNPHETGSPGAANQAAGLAWDAPSGLERSTPASSMRIAQYTIPTADGTKPGELVLFFFGSGQGGATQANLERWAGQFEQADGSNPMSKAKTLTFTNPHGLKITTIEVPGRYVTTGMGAGPDYDEPGWKLYGAVVEGPGGPWFWKGVGPETSINAHQEEIRSLLQSLRPASS